MKNKPNTVTVMKNRSLPAEGPPLHGETSIERDTASSRGCSSGSRRAIQSLLHLLRVFTGLLFLCWLLPLAGHIDEFFSRDGWLDRKAYEEIATLPLDQRPMFGWSLYSMVDGDSSAVHFLYWFTVAVLIAFTLGVATRITSILTWVLMLSCVTVISGLSAPAGHNEIDLMVMFAFYLMVGYVLLGQFNGALTMVERILGPKSNFILSPLLGKRAGGGPPTPPSYAANLAVRLIQIHFALFVFTNFLFKMQIGDWWSGVALWYPMHGPFETTPDQIRSEATSAMSRLFFYSLATYLVLGWQLTFPLFAWRKRFRPLLLAGGVIAWIGLSWVYSMPAIGPLWLIGCASYITAEEWHRVGRRIGETCGHFLGNFAAAKPDSRVPASIR